jgi:predicted TIM-barrel fold metal-dependent hydrolase
VRRVWGEDASLLERAGAPVAELQALEDQLEAALGLPGRGSWLDAHVHLGRDRDGHRLAVDDLVRDLDRWGIARAVCFAANDAGPDGRFGAANAAVLDAARRSDGRVLPFCRIDPTRPWREVMERAEAGGARGVKLHPIAQRFRPEDPEAVAVVRAAAERGWPVMIHAGFGARPLAGPLTELADAVSEARLILAHGGRGDARAIRERLAGRPGVLLDTSLATLPDLLEIPPRALCFGSDRPYGEHASALQLVALAAAIAGWSPEQQEGVMGGTLAAWLPAAA